VVNVGDEIECVVESLDPVGKRVSLRRVTARSRPARPRPRRCATSPPAAAEGRRPGGGHRGQDRALRPVRALPERARAHPQRRDGHAQGADHRKLFPVGTTFKAAIIEIDGQAASSSPRPRRAGRGARRVPRLHEGAAEVPVRGKGFGTLGDLLKSLKK
jgi:hypothetical protein